MRYRLLALAFLPLTLGADWRQFRGTDSTGHAAGGAPTEFGADKNMAWKAVLPGHGLSSPIVVDRRVFVTASGGPKQDRLQVLAIDAKSGKQLWQQPGMTGWVTPSPVFGHGLIFATSGKDGPTLAVKPGGSGEVKPAWQHLKGGPYVCSPVLYGDYLVLNRDNEGQSHLLVIDARSGEVLWKADRDEVSAWATVTKSEYSCVPSVGRVVRTAPPSTSRLLT